MMRAIWNGTVIAESPHTVEVEGNQYFPVDSLHRQYFTDSAHHTICSWKGQASYYTVTVDGSVNPDAAWYYPDPSTRAGNIKDHVAFWRGVEITNEPG